MPLRARIVRIVIVAAGILTVLTAFSLGRHVLAHPNYGVQQNVATWARNKGLGFAVDRLEMWLHSDAPATAPAASLALDATPDTSVPDTVPDTTLPATTTAVATTTTAPVATTRVPTTTTSTTSTTSTTTTTIPLAPGETTTTVETTTTTTTLPPPTDVSPVISPALRGEGKWRVLFTLGKTEKQPVVWGMSTRPLRRYGSVVATAAVFDQSRLRAAMFNGGDVPGRGPWVNSRRVPPRALRSLVAAFNGGFRFEHKPGGYMTEGRTVRPMKKGYGTLGIDSQGTLHVGVWGEDMGRDGDWVSLRQNLPPLVTDGRITWTDWKSTDWGTDYGDKMYTFRSGICRRTDGTLMFVAVGDVNIDMLARTMLQFGCSTGMELDINGNWPHFSTYTGYGTTERRGRTLDTRMGDPQRYLNGYEKDFFALFDPDRLPEGLLR